MNRDQMLRLRAAAKAARMLRLAEDALEPAWAHKSFILAQGVIEVCVAAVVAKDLEGPNKETDT
jgi:hypothetical protein